MKRNDDTNAFDEPERSSEPFQSISSPACSGYYPHSQAQSTCI